jgi:hypothetical protein
MSLSLSPAGENQEFSKKSTEDAINDLRNRCITAQEQIGARKSRENKIRSEIHGILENLEVEVAEVDVDRGSESAETEKRAEAEVAAQDKIK